MGKIELKKQNVKGSAFFKLALPPDIPHVSFFTSTRSIKDLASFCRLIDIEAADVVQAEQVHGHGVARVTKNDRGRIVAGCDAMITNEAGLPLAVRTADCVAFLIFDVPSPSIGLVHAGWRGAVSNIAAKTLREMRKIFDTRGENCIIAMTPSIGKCCFEVDDAVIEPLRRSFAGWEKAATKRGGRWMLDLRLLNEMQLAEAGVKKENIVRVDLCTSCNSGLFYSWRKERTAERMYSVAMLGVI